MVLWCLQINIYVVAAAWVSLSQSKTKTSHHVVLAILEHNEKVAIHEKQDSK